MSTSRTHSKPHARPHAKQHPDPHQQALENHGIIGDLQTAALVARDGCIDFCCWPQFDSPSIFASLLGEGGGFFEISPTFEVARYQQLYLPDTNVLLTRFLSGQGVAELSDFMAIAAADPAQRLVRRVKAIRSAITFRMRCAPAFNYARSGHTLRKEGETIVFTPEQGAGPALRLRADIPLGIDQGAAVAEFQLPAGKSASFVLEDASHGLDGAASHPHYVPSAFKSTSNYWRRWVARSSYTGRWRDTVNRSSLALKLLTSKTYGSIIASPTFGLPETLGGSRNWDYRYTWIRDAAFTVYAFLRLGHVEEANAFMRWLRDRVAARTGQLQPVYRLDGSSSLEEFELPNLSGYCGSLPVRVGNAASNQIQMDIYGELMDAIYLADKYGEQVSVEAWEGITLSTRYVVDNWRQPDEGIWEIRNNAAELLHSRVMCWVALDRSIRLARKRSLPAPLADWTRTRDEIYAEIHGSFWNPSLGYFTQTRSNTSIDASCLLMPLVRFISPTDPRWLSTLRNVERRLTDDSLVYRYSDDDGFDGLEGLEGTFNMCSFWYVECVARAGDLAKARYLFEKMLGYASPLGLFAEETGAAGEHLGNFPQAFTHLALISAAYYLDHALSQRG